MKKNLFKQAALFTILSGATLLTGCGAMPESQTISVVTENSEGTPVENVHCELNNKRGSWVVKTPGEVKLLRSKSKLNINCENNQWQIAQPLQVKSDSHYAYSAGEGAIQGFGVGFLSGLPISGLMPVAPIAMGGILAIPGAGIRMALDGARGGVYEYPAKITVNVIPRSAPGEAASARDNDTPVSN